MSVIDQQLVNLSPEKQALFERLLNNEKAQQNIARTKQQEQKELKNTLTQIETDWVNRNEPFPLTDIQQAQWIGGRSGAFDFGDTAAHGYVEFDLEDADLPRLEKAWQRLVELHDQLRMIVLPDELKQKVLADVAPYEIELQDLSGLTEEERSLRMTALRERMSHQLFPGDRWPLWEVKALRIDDSITRLHISFDLLVGDAWCFRMLLDRWTKLYNDPALEVKKPAVQFRDYVLGLEDLKTTPLHEKCLSYWQDRLPLLPPAPELPLAPATKSKQRTKHYGINISPDAWQRIKARTQREGLTPSALFLAALSEIITLWSKSPKFTMNVTVFNRLPVHPNVDDIMIGEFNSFVLLEVDYSSQTPFITRAKALQSQLWEDLEHRFVSGVRIMRELAKVTKRNTGGLMPVVFTSTLAHYEDEADQPSEWPGELVYEVSQTPQIWMEHHVWEEKDGLLIHCDVVESAFPEGLFDEVIKAYETFLTRLADDPDSWQQISREYLVPEAQLEQRRAVNDTTQDVAIETLPNLFAKQVKLNASKDAVVSGRGTLTYGQLDECSSKLANHLVELGAHTNKLIAVVMEPGWEQVVAILGILRSGAAYLPIDASTPLKRLQLLLEQADIEIVLSQKEVAGDLEVPAGIQSLCVDEFDYSHHEAISKDVRNALEDLAYVIFTSGSTGIPKGVMISHESVVNTLLDVNARFGVSSEDRLLSLSSLSFDLSVYDIFGMLIAGGTVVIPNPKQAKEPDHWLELAHRQEITVWNSVPALMDMMVRHCEDQQTRLPGSLNLVLLSGDWIPVDLPSRVNAMSQQANVISLGGATEASIWSISYPVDHLQEGSERIPYGKPLTNQQFYVLNDHFENCPTWVTGQLYIAGNGLAKGYWKDAEKTAASFVTHPRSGNRLYRTGDLGRYLPDGNIEFLGREDAQVKIRGYRIELGEIESQLQSHPDVEAGAALAVGETAIDANLVAYIVPRPQATIDVDEVARFLKQRLPDYMVPPRYELLEAMPLTANGKVDRKSLINQNAVAKKKPFVEPRTEVEKEVATLWKYILETDTVGIYDDFFELGGNSLLATQLAFKLREAFQIDLPIAELFEAANVEKLALMIEELLIKEIEQMTEEEAEFALEQA